MDLRQTGSSFPSSGPVGKSQVSWWEGTRMAGLRLVSVLYQSPTSLFLILVSNGHWACDSLKETIFRLSNLYLHPFSPGRAVDSTPSTPATVVTFSLSRPTVKSLATLYTQSMLLNLARWCPPDVLHNLNHIRHLESCHLSS